MDKTAYLKAKLLLEAEEGMLKAHEEEQETKKHLSENKHHAELLDKVYSKDK